MWVVALLVLGLLPWLLGEGPCRRCWSLIPLATALLIHGFVQLGDGLVTVERFIVTGCWLAIVGVPLW